MKQFVLFYDNNDNDINGGGRRSDTTQCLSVELTHERAALTEAVWYREKRKDNHHCTVLISAVQSALEGQIQCQSRYYMHWSIPQKAEKAGRNNLRSEGLKFRTVAAPTIEESVMKGDLRPRYAVWRVTGVKRTMTLRARRDKYV